MEHRVDLSTPAARGRSRARRALGFLAAGWLVAVAVPGQAPPPEASFGDRADVIEVEIPINVADRHGEPVRALTAADFEIYDQGELQDIVNFRVVDLSLVEPGISRTEIEAAVPGAARRHFMLLFDLSFSSPHALLRAREAARKFVVEQLHPTDLVSVATHSAERGAQLLVTFTPDRVQLARAIDTLGAPRLLGLERQDPLRFMIEDPDLIRTESFAEFDADSPKSSLEQSVAAHIRVIGKEIAKTERSFSRGRISLWSRSMGELAKTLDSVSGRKNIIYFSEGFDGRLLLGRRPDGNDDGANEDLNNLLTGNISLVDTDQMYGNAGLQSDVALMLAEFRRADCVIQAIDIGGLRASQPAEQRMRDGGQDALFYIANDTGGELYRNANDFGSQLNEVLTRSSVTYLVTIRPKDLTQDGAYHRLKIKANVPKGARVAAREGYYAPRPYEELAPFEKSLLAADAIATAVESRDIVMSVLAVPFRAGDQGAYVPIVVEAGGASLLEGHDDTSLPVEVFAYVTDRAGEMKDFFTQRVTLDLNAAARTVFAETGLKYYGHLEMAPGQYLIRVLVRNARTGRSGVQTVALEVPEYELAEPLMLPPFVVDAGRWFLVREEAPQNYTGSVVYPFTVKGEPYIPAARAAVSADQEANLCVVAYNLEPVDFDLDGQILGKDGEVVAVASFNSFERTVTGIQGVDKFVARLETRGLSQGEYTLRVALSNSSGARHTESIPLIIN
jgi:VWFA-related protein